ncbi:protein mono-ADP-ribosyltransferase PARP12-like isoform X2 [Apus apus]|uniref:protein mono-ADP-ribosyltransferase PARP12-like isoform X2 n=1 Tax=Apus apus TaxID=8895 RepID=UPI0021F8E6B5|nr:protein mono-ADP-ribosyltransferase PARP12-like isoform X2 [Apus apus]
MEYAWYWLDDSGQWIEYGKEHPDHCSATVTSADLEKQFLTDQNGLVLFRAGSQKYKLNLKDMVQTNLFYETQRKVARLPKFQSFCQSQNLTLSSSVFPPQWDQSALPDTGFKLIQLGSTSHEYGEIKRLFEKTMKDCCIQQLQRIQNPTLWQVFQWQKEQMKKLSKSKRVDERLLFHGTSSSNIPAICEQNFDWRMCGTHGTMYGKGYSDLCASASLQAASEAIPFQEGLNPPLSGLRKLLCQRRQLFSQVLLLSQWSLQHVCSSGSCWRLCSGKLHIPSPSTQTRQFKQTL